MFYSSNIVFLIFSFLRWSCDIRLSKYCLFLFLWKRLTHHRTWCSTRYRKMNLVDLWIYTITVILLITFQCWISPGELAQMIERPLHLHGGGTGIDTRILQDQHFCNNGNNFLEFFFFIWDSLFLISAHKTRVVCQDVLPKLTVSHLLCILLALQQRFLWFTLFLEQPDHCISFLLFYFFLVLVVCCCFVTWLKPF